MSSTYKTPNLKLSQWVLSDPFNMADFNEDNLKVDSAVGDIPLVKLIDVTLQEQAQTVEIDLSGMDLTQFVSLRLYQRSEYSNINLRVNKISDSYKYVNSYGNWQDCSGYSYSYLGYIDIELNSSSLYMHSRYKLYKLPVSMPPESIKTLDLIRDPSNSGKGSYVYPVGTRFILMGVKK